MRRTLQYKINGAILITFIVIGFIFISIQLPLQNRRNEMISKKIEVLLHTLVERDREPIANEIYQGLTRALAIRLDQMKELNGILSISVFDKAGKLLVSRGPYPETRSLSGADITEPAGDIQIHYQKWHGQFALVYLRDIRVIGEQIGFIRISYSLNELIREQRLSWLTLSGLLAAVLIVMLILLNVIMSRTIVKPILSLSKTMGRIKAGKIEQHVYRKSNDEIEALSEAFNKMSGDLAASYQELELNRARLLETRLYLENIINSMPSILLGVDNDMKITHWNLKAVRKSGVEAEAAIGKPLTEMFPQIAGWTEKVSRALNDGTARKDENVPWKINGNQMYMDITVYPLITNGADGAVIRIDDVTDRKLTEEALRESQEKYRLVVDNANDLIIIIQDGFIKYANPKAVSVSGYTVEELADVPFIDLIMDEDKEMVLSNYTTGMQGRSVPNNYSFRFRNKAGKRLWLNASGVLISWNNRPATLTFIRDITDQKRVEEQLLHAQKMEAIGTLAGGIAHDFNNLLQIIQGYAQFLLLDNKDLSPFRLELEAIMSAAMKGSDLTRQLLTFGRKVESHQKPVDINVQVEKAKNVLSRTIPKTIEIQLLLADDLSDVSADPGQIEQVLINLVINARDAMPEGGKILIETEKVMLDEEEFKTRFLSSPGEYVRLRISDTGHGISKELLDHIFEPFFTTKNVGEGTGLGLSMVYGIIKDHNGAIHCHSMPGEGTTFEIYMPAVASHKKLHAGKVSPAPMGGTETILIVDDEETLREISRRILERFGYTILMASDGENALALYLREKKRIHLVLLDLVMPGMDGRNCLSELLKLNPDVKVIIASGYFSDGNKDASLDGAGGFIKKPFDLKNMLSEIRRVLDEKKKSPA